MQQASLSPEDTLGDRHPDTLGSIYFLGTLLHAQGDLDGARALFREAVDGARETLGEEHPHTKVFVQELQAVGA